LPATLAVDALLHEGEDDVWVIPTLDVFPNGFRVNVVLLLNPHRQHDIQARIHRGPMGMMRIGVRFADGRVGGRGLPYGAMGAPKDDDGIPTEPFVGFGGGGGGMGGWRFSAWVFPLPPDGPLEILVALPAPAYGEVRPQGAPVAGPMGHSRPRGWHWRPVAGAETPRSHLVVCGAG
jgi:hypothetical protein